LNAKLVAAAELHPQETQRVEISLSEKAAQTESLTSDNAAQSSGILVDIGTDLSTLGLDIAGISGTIQQVAQTAEGDVKAFVALRAKMDDLREVRQNISSQVDHANSVAGTASETINASRSTVENTLGELSRLIEAAAKNTANQKTKEQAA